ncbi:MAG: coproporphyrinogen III oxidase family protein [Chloroflexi bacterium]|nr:coproporphyrinogen III oxidase family protein [Chloroflexota bacterium]
MPAGIARPEALAGSGPPEALAGSGPPEALAGSGAPEALYIHVPFCVSVCPYCDFVVVGGAAARGPRSRVAAFAAAVRRELEMRADVLDARWGAVGGGARPPLRSLYLGGGTPSLLPAAEVASLIALVRERFGLAPDAEITLEANPGPDERGDAAELAAAGVTRISFGAQAMDDAALARLGRRHRARDVAAAVDGARRAGIASINLDLLYDVPGTTEGGWVAGLEAALALGPDHLSLYALTLDDPDAEGLTGAGGDHLPVSRGARAWRTRARQEQDEDRAASMYEHATERLEIARFDGYEISNWARPGHESRHNLAYWERRPFEAAGPGAHAFDGATRRWNAARLDAYFAALTPVDGGPGRLPPGGTEAVSPSGAAAERVILGLRLGRGIAARLGDEAPLSAHLGLALDAGLLRRSEDGERFRLTTRGRLLSNELFARLV